MVEVLIRLGIGTVIVFGYLAALAVILYSFSWVWREVRSRRNR